MRRHSFRVANRKLSFHEPLRNAAARDMPRLCLHWYVIHSFIHSHLIITTDSLFNELLMCEIRLVHIILINEQSVEC